jgi:hypothetical protein
MGQQDSLLSSQAPTTCPYPVPDQSSPDPPILFTVTNTINWTCASVGHKIKMSWHVSRKRLAKILFDIQGLVWEYNIKTKFRKLGNCINWLEIVPSGEICCMWCHSMILLFVCYCGAEPWCYWWCATVCSVTVCGAEPWCYFWFVTVWQWTMVLQLVFYCLWC